MYLHICISIYVYIYANIYTSTLHIQHTMLYIYIYIHIRAHSVTEGAGPNTRSGTVLFFVMYVRLYVATQNRRSFGPAGKILSTRPEGDTLRASVVSKIVVPSFLFDDIASYTSKMPQMM